MTTHTPRQITDSTLETSAIFRCSGVSLSSSVDSIWAMRPTSVSIPVEVTTQVARPLVITVDEITMFFRSPSTVSSGRLSMACLLTGTDSPVMADSSAFRFALSRIRASAGTRSPASSTMTSPGTSLLVSTRTISPPRITFASGADIFCSASSALFALSSWVMEITVFTTTISRMISGSTQSSKPLDTNDSTAAISSTMIIGSFSCPRTRTSMLSCLCPSSSLAPYFSRRAALSASDRPVSRSVWSSFSTSSSERVYHDFIQIPHCHCGFNLNLQKVKRWDPFAGRPQISPILK